MEFIRELSKTKKILLAIVLTIFILSIGFFIYHKFFFVDKANIYYRVYTKEKGWSSWRKNGETAGNGKYEIKKIQLRTSRKEGFSKIAYGIYSKGKWIHEEALNSTDKEYDIRGLKVSYFDKRLSSKFSICYRTYNDENKWMPWTCDGNLNGNKEQTMKAIEIKAISINDIKNEQLKDYDLNISSIDEF